MPTFRDAAVAALLLLLLAAGCATAPAADRNPATAVASCSTAAGDQRCSVTCDPGYTARCTAVGAEVRCNCVDRHSGNATWQ